MAQQTINVGTAPNDGTGTPLRTAFQYTNSNFSELYTATGPSGNNITVPGTATITGNLTVDTNTLFVDSANDRVGIGLAAGINAKLHVSSTGSVHINQRTGGNGCFTQYVDPVSSNYVGTDSGNFRVVNNSAQDLLNIQQLGVFSFGDGAGGTRMTLNSTGLGVGGRPTRKLSIVGSGNTYANINSGDNTSLVGILLGGSSSPSNGQLIYDNTANSMALLTAGNTRLTIDSAGNVGIGVTPSAWVTFKALELGELGGAIAAGGNNTAVLYNAYFNSGFKYARSGVASSYYQQTLGAHAWYTAPSGTAGNAITFTQAMTLDASGNLLVGTTAAAGSASNSTKTVGGIFSSCKDKGI